MHYKNRISCSFILIVGLPMMILIIFWIIENFSLPVIVKAHIIFSIYAYIIFCYVTSTRYFIFDNELVIQCFWFKHRIRYSTIIHVKRSKYLSSGYKYAASLEGLIIHRDSALSIFISPTQQCQFVHSLNSHIDNAVVRSQCSVQD